MKRIITNIFIPANDNEHENLTITKTTRIETDEEYKQRLSEEKLEKIRLKMNKKQTRIYNILETMLDRFHEAGVDVSYFPDSAERIMIETAKKLAK